MRKSRTPREREHLRKIETLLAVLLTLFGIDASLALSHKVAQAIVLVVTFVVAVWLARELRGRLAATVASVPVAGLLVAIAIAGGLFSAGPIPTIKEPPFEPHTGEQGIGGVYFAALTESGECFRSKIDPNRSEAYECVTRHNHGDPCFKGGRLVTMECFFAPWKAGRITLGIAEPHIASAAEAVLGARWEKPWALELPDHIRCVRTLNLPAVHPAGLLYGCERSGRLDGWIANEFPNETTTTWQVAFRPYGRERESESSSFVRVVRAWI